MRGNGPSGIMDVRRSVFLLPNETSSSFVIADGGLGQWIEIGRR